MLILYPDIKPFHSRHLQADDVHSIYVEESGNPTGIPVLFVHGGPGGGCSPQDRCFFDPEKYHIILFDQRGAGRSRPHAELRNNTTQALIGDMEKIRRALGVERWILFGGSWGSTLSLLYAQAHPKRVLGLILRGVFLARRQDLDWLYQGGASYLFPDHWEDFVQTIPEEERHDMIGAYYKRLTGSNELAEMAAAKAWCLWEAHCSTLRPCQEVVERSADPHRALAMARIEAHYFANNCFIAENQIINEADKLAGIPGIIVHGRYDVVCTLDNAFTLHKVWHDSQLNIVRDAGHASREAGIVDALIRATRDMAARFQEDFPTRGA